MDRFVNEQLFIAGFKYNFYLASEYLFHCDLCDFYSRTGLFCPVSRRAFRTEMCPIFTKLYLKKDGTF